MKSRSLALTRSTLFISGILFSTQLIASAQCSPNAAELPQAPAAQSAPANPRQTASAAVSGTIVDTNGDVIQGARVAVQDSSGANAQSTQSGPDGQFAFSGLAPGAYKLTVTANGMSSYSSSMITLNPGDVHIVPQIVLAYSGGETTITVTADKEVLSEQQVQIAVQQRVLSVFPNFYTTYDWNAPPMLAKQKFKLSLRNTIDPTAFVVNAGVAAAEQYKNVYPGYGGGWEGYGKRYGAQFANHVSAQFFGNGLYPSLFRQDPRYFYMGKGTVTHRALYAIAATLIARSDSGRWEPNYSNVLGSFTAAGISNLYYPESDRGVSLTFFNGFTELGADAVENLLEEFVLRPITSHAPKDENGQP